MRLLSLVSVAVVLAGVLGLATPAHADSTKTLWATCGDEENEYPPEREIAACTKLIESGKLTPGFLGGAYYDRGVAYFKLGDYPHTIADESEAIRINPLAGDFFTTRGNAYFRQRDYAHATADYDEAIRLEPQDAGAYFNRSKVYAAQRDYAHAIADNDQAVRIEPKNPVFLNGLCRQLALANQDLVRARDTCDAALRIAPNTADILNSRGLVGLKQSRFQDAWNDYDAALRIAPTSASHRYGRGLAAIHLGRTADGNADLVQAQATNQKIADIYAGYGITP